MADHAFVRGCFSLARNLILAVLLYGSIFTLVHMFQSGSAPSAASFLKNPLALGEPASSPDTAPEQVWKPGFPPASFKLEKINPYANWFNRPLSLVAIKDDYMGKRPDVDTVANLTKLVETCRGSYEKIELMEDRAHCFKYLVDGEKDYFSIPEKSQRASFQSPKDAAYLNSDGQDNTLSEYPSAKAASKSSPGRCHGPIIPYHVYWTGPATWRSEVFIKSYLYTQNLPCSRLWFWIDTDKNPDGVEDLLTRDPQFARFLPLVERGDIIVKRWKFPSRIPLPEGDNTDGVGYYATPGHPNAAGEIAIADGLIRDVNGQEWLILTDKQKTFLPVAVSDAVRFVVLHLYGGVYLDMDVTLLRDMRPLVLGPDSSFAERWGMHPDPGDYNTAVLSLTANSSFSSYLLRGGVRMGMNFHPRVIGRMAVKDKRNRELHMLETSLFDPIWWEYGGDLPCTVPCFRHPSYSAIFRTDKAVFPNDCEWEAYEGPQEPHIIKIKERDDLDQRLVAAAAAAAAKDSRPKDGIGSVHKFDQAALAKAEYRIEEDNYPPTNRTMQHFFKGAWAYHVHNQWATQPEPSSWFDVIRRAHNDFFAGKRTNMYGEKWNGPEVIDYEIIWKFV